MAFRKYQTVEKVEPIKKDEALAAKTSSTEKPKLSGLKNP